MFKILLFLIGATCFAHVEEKNTILWKKVSKDKEEIVVRRVVVYDSAERQETTTKTRKIIVKKGK